MTGIEAGAAVASALAAVAGTTYGVAAGEDQKRRNKNALRRADQEKQRAMGEAASAKRMEDQKIAVANRKKPNLASLLASTLSGSGGGVSSTLLSQPKTLLGN
jgi:membrane protease subunit (stomatin/prohibitin family)